MSKLLIKTTWSQSSRALRSNPSSFLEETSGNFKDFF